jgi:hypothetical protein
VEAVDHIGKKEMEEKKVANMKNKAVARLPLSKIVKLNGFLN